MRTNAALAAQEVAFAKVMYGALAIAVTVCKTAVPEETRRRTQSCAPPRNGWSLIFLRAIGFERTTG